MGSKKGNYKSPKRRPAYTNEVGNAEQRKEGPSRLQLAAERREKVRRWHAEGATDAGMAARLGIAAGTVANMRRKLGLLANVEGREGVKGGLVVNMGAARPRGRQRDCLL